MKRADRPPRSKRRRVTARPVRPARGCDDVAANHNQPVSSSSDDAILSKDLDGVILSWNRGAERLFGLPAEAVSRPVTIIIPLDRLDEEPAILGEKIHRGERTSTSRLSGSVRTEASSTFR